MSDLFNPIGRSVPGLTGPTVVTGVIADPPRNLIGMAPGTIMRGTVLGRGPDGLTSVATEAGTVKVATTAQWPPGSAVMLEVRTAGDRLQVLILSVDTTNARSPASGAAAGGASSSSAASSTAAGGDASAASTSRPPPPLIEVVGSSLRAIVVQYPSAQIPAGQATSGPTSGQAPPGLNPAILSQLIAPDAGTELFIGPAGPISVPADAALKAQLLAQARLLVEPEAPGSALPSGGNASVSRPAVPTVTPVPGSALQPEVAQRIAALFAAESGEGIETAMSLPATATGVTAGPIVATPRVSLPAGTELTLHVIAVLPTQGGELEIAPEAARLAGNVAPLIGRVLGYTRAGYPVIETAAGTLMIQQKTRLPVGAQVALVLEPVTSPPPAANPAVTTPQQALLFLSRGWPTLDDLLAVLRTPSGLQTDPDVAVTSSLPQTGSKLAAGLANAITALRTGDVEKLIGSLLLSRKLPEGKEEAVKRLRQEFAQLSDLAQDRPAVDWRALFLPVYDARAGLTQINLYYRHNHGGSAGDPEHKDQGTRFLVDVNFVVLGAFQLDGLIRGKRFDLMIRSRRRLSQGQRREIHGIFEEALGVGGYAGSLEFRTVETFPVSPLDELRKSHDRLTA